MSEREPPVAAEEHTGDAAAASAGEAKASPEALLKQAEARAEENKDAWLRAKAETENVRKRAQLDITAAYKYAVEDFAERLLPVRDALEAALATPNPTVETLHGGVELTLKQLDAVFEKARLAEINPIGEKFDPHQHQAISMVPADGEANRVVSVLQKGYRLHDRMLRPALVTVSKAPDA
jgi:molecular chaperone GrpE